MNRVIVITATTGLLALSFASGAALAQQAYPAKPIRFIVPYGPGASTDNTARIYGQKMLEAWGQPVIVENRAGGNTVTGTEVMVRSPADGYTIMIVANTHAINPLLMANLPYDPVKDFAPVATIGAQEYLLAVNPAVPVKNLREFIAYAKSKPGALNYGSSGSGGLGHLSGELFNSLAGVKMVHIPYKGGAPAVTDLVGGQVQAMIASTSAFLPMLKAGRLRALAISGKVRGAATPDVPTFAEAGLPAFESTNWLGVLVPGATPRDVVNKLSGELTRVQATADVKEKLGNQGIDVWPNGPEQFAAVIKSDMEKFAKIVKSANIKLEL